MTNGSRAKCVLATAAILLASILPGQTGPDAQLLTYDIADNGGGPVVSEHSQTGSAQSFLQPGIARWVADSARAVSAFYGRFPVRTRLFVRAGGEGKIGGGVTWGTRPAATIRIAAGAATTDEDLRQDWVLPHEMVHLALPNLGSSHSWLEEGIATYIEPIARVKAGLVPRDEVWRWLLWGLPRGLPEPGDRGLDSDNRWGRTYWGGALFCLTADIEIRRATQNRRSLGDALRGVLEAGGNVSTGWSISRVLQAGDRAVGVRVLEPLYKRMGTKPGGADLERLFAQLGVRGTPSGVSFDEGAPLASLRHAITNDAREDAPVAARRRASRRPFTRIALGSTY